MPTWPLWESEGGPKSCSAGVEKSGMALAQRALSHHPLMGGEVNWIVES